MKSVYWPIHRLSILPFNSHRDTHSPTQRERERERDLNSVCLFKCPSIFFHILTSSESLGQFPSYLTYSVPSWKRFKFQWRTMPFVKSYIVKIHWRLNYFLEPPGQFQPNLAQNILGLRKFSFLKMKDHALFLRGDNSNKLKIYWQLLKIYPEPLGQFQPNMTQSILG